MRAPGKPAFPIPILLVDDDKHIIRTVGDYLRAEGFDVTAATSGEEALREIERSRPALVILDLGMPGMGGLGFLRRIGERADLPRLPILVFTARASMEGFLTEIDIDGFLAKPCSGAALVEKVRSILRDQSRHAAAQNTAPGTNKHVIVVEDNPTRADQLHDALSAAGYQVSMIKDGMDLFRVASRTLPNLILIKEFIGLTRGADLALVIRGHHATATIPILLYDSNDLPGTSVKGLASRAVDEVIHSPDTATLVAAVNRFMRDPS